MPSAIPFPNRVMVRVKGPSPTGLAVRLRFQMRAKNAFSYLVFLDSHGVAEVSGEELLRAFDEDRNAFIMDYLHPRTGFTGKIEANVFTATELQAAVEAFDMFRGHLTYPKDYELRLLSALHKKANPENYEVEVRIK